jgi:putative SOS response-associated peptidase YedK
VRVEKSRQCIFLRGRRADESGRTGGVTGVRWPRGLGKCDVFHLTVDHESQYQIIDVRPIYPKVLWRELVELYRLTSQAARNIEPRYNIAPTTRIDVVRVRDGGRELVPMRWGLVPSWWKKSARETPATFNARSESVAEKPMFRSAFRRSRCIIPASGYYEWRTDSGMKQPYYFSAADEGVLSIAGLWDQWTDIESGGPLLSCTLIVTAANTFAAPIHDRMPVFLSPDSIGSCFDGSGSIELLRPASHNVLQVWPVSKRVNRPGNGDDATLIDPIT